MNLVNRTAVSLFQRLRRMRVQRLEVSGKRLLDVGAGDGRFVLEMASRGWDAYGCEPAVVGQAQAKKSGIGDRIIYGTVETLPDTAPPYDVITMWHALEHVENPVDLLQTLQKHLTPRGRILISVPNHAGWVVQWFGAKSFHLDVPRHRFHFSPKSLSALLTRCGYQVNRISHFSLEYSPFGWWQTLLNACGLEHNGLYRWLKRGGKLTRRTGAARAGAAVATLLLSVIFVPLSFVLSTVEAFVRRGMIITVSAEKS
ncbi:MAG: class I SAM-dependent methyltransferase [Acidobacteriia bacterium]|nr:class I SAM-dependent methyltransferase [Terriglobia bacterium]